MRGLEVDCGLLDPGGSAEIQAQAHVAIARVGTLVQKVACRGVQTLGALVRVDVAIRERATALENAKRFLERGLEILAGLGVFRRIGWDHLGRIAARHCGCRAAHRLTSGRIATGCSDSSPGAARRAT